MNLHYALWVLIALMTVLGGALYRGQEDMLSDEKAAIMSMSILAHLPIKDLGEIRVGKI